MVFASIVETYIAAFTRGNGNGVLAISLLALSQATAVLLFYMQLKYEPNSIKAFSILALMFLVALFAASIATLA